MSEGSARVGKKWAGVPLSFFSRHELLSRLYVVYEVFQCLVQGKCRDERTKVWALKGEFEQRAAESG